MKEYEGYCKRYIIDFHKATITLKSTTRIQHFLLCLNPLLSNAAFSALLKVQMLQFRLGITC